MSKLQTQKRPEKSEIQELAFSRFEKAKISIDVVFDFISTLDLLQVGHSLKDMPDISSLVAHFVIEVNDG